MKAAHAAGAIGSIVIIIGAMLKIFHIAISNPDTLILLGLILIIASLEWKLKLLGKQVKKLEADGKLTGSAALS